MSAEEELAKFDASTAEVGAAADRNAATGKSVQGTEKEKTDALDSAEFQFSNAAFGVTLFVGGRILGRQLDFWANDIGLLKHYAMVNRATNDVSDAAEKSKVFTTLMKSLPGGIGSTFKKIEPPFNSVREVLIGAPATLADKLDTMAKTHEQTLKKLTTIKRVVDTVDFASISFGAVTGIMAGVAALQGKSGNSAGEAAGDTIKTLPDSPPTPFPEDLGAPAKPPLLTDASDDLARAIAAMNLRYRDATAPTILLSTEVEARVAEIRKELNDALIVPLQAVQAISDTFRAFVAEIQDVADDIQDVADLLGALSAPFDPIFDFLENPPSIDLFFDEIDLFPAISREDITRIIDFITGISDFVLGFFDPIFEPLVAPIRDLLNDILKDLNPLKPLNDTLADMLAGFTDILNRLDVIEPKMREVLDELKALADIDVPLGEEFAPSQGHNPADRKATFFGSEASEYVMGEIPTTPLVGDDIPGAILSGAGGRDTLIGTAVRDFLLGGADEDLLFGGAGDDLLLGGKGADVIHGGKGADELFGDGGDDIIFADDGSGPDASDDLIDGGSGQDVAVFSGNLADYVIERAPNEIRVTGPDGADLLRNVEVLRFGDQDVVAARDAIGEQLDGTEFDDLLLGGIFDDVIFGEEGNDAIFGNGGNDVIVGGDGDDLIDGGAGDDDRAIFQRTDREENQFLVTDRGLQVTGPRGVDLLTGIEFLVFRGVIIPISEFETIAPTIAPGSLDAFIGGLAELDLATLGDDVDAADDGTTLRYAVVTQPDLGSVAIDGSVLRFDHGGNFDRLAEGAVAELTTVVNATDSLGAVSDARELTIRVTGVNDAPELKAGKMSGTENAERMTLDLGELGNDVDGDDDGHSLSYSIVSGPVNGRAVIDGAILRFIPLGAFDSLNNGETATEIITIQARDRHGADSVTRNVTVTITGIDDPPNLAPSYVALSGTTVRETAEPGTVVAALHGDDLDGDPLSFALVSDADGKFEILGDKLVTRDSFDFDAAASHEITVAAFDPDGASATYTVSVTVIEVDAAATGVSLSASSLAEDATAGTVVGSLLGSGPGAGAMTFVLTDTAGGLFDLEGRDLVLAGAVDFEAAASHEVTVEVTDGSGATFSETFDIAVTNVNEAPEVPVLSNATIAEDAAPGSVVGRLSSPDPEGDAVTFALISDAGGLFALDGNRIVTLAALDFETAASHVLTVQASDPFGLFRTADLVVAVVDVNDPTKGDDRLVGTGETDIIDGLRGDDDIFGLGGRDVLVGSAGRDRLFGGGGGDLLKGGGGNDRLFGGGGGDTLMGQLGADSIFGRGGGDSLTGGSGGDTLSGGKGRDEIDGGRGNDDLTGGGGGDVFRFAARFGSDTITDFGKGADRIDLSGFGLSFDTLDREAANEGADTLILVGRNQILLEGFDEAQLRAGMFDFV